MEKDLIEYIAKSLVDDPGAVSVTESEGDKSTILELRVAEDDIGKVIGKYGRIAKAFRQGSGKIRLPRRRHRAHKARQGVLSVRFPPVRKPHNGVLQVPLRVFLEVRSARKAARGGGNKRRRRRQYSARRAGQIRQKDVRLPFRQPSPTGCRAVL